MDIKHKKRFLELVCQLSPENLTCDGELSANQVIARRRQLTREWGKLEKAVGRKVYDREVWAWSDEVHAHEQEELARELAEEPNDPRLEHTRPGVWVRKGSNGLAAYYVWGPSHNGPRYTLWSEFARCIKGQERVAEFDTWAQAVKAGEQLMSCISEPMLACALPGYRPEHVRRELERLPAEHLAQR